MKPVHLVIVSVITVAGCVMNGIPNFTLTKTSSTERVEKIFTGIPLLLSVEGSSVRLDDTWYLTAAHNKTIMTLKLDDVYYHPYCGIALVKEYEEGVSPVTFSSIKENEPLTLIGYPMGTPLASNQGYHVGFLNIASYIKCTAVDATTATTVSGMSGGGVFNSNEEVVGVIGGIVTDDITIIGGKYDQQTLTTSSYFTNVYEVRDWIESVTGVDYFKEE
ncbi:hypothetical protein [Vibrio phage S4-7]|nr:hypothetical protein [Vibrio phage S4-7]